MLKIAALGWFKAIINGTEITAGEVFTMPWTDYNKSIEYSVYCITDLVKEENAFAVVLGNGWACGSEVWGAATKYYGVNNPAFIAEITLTYKDKTSESFPTDESWKANTGEIIYNDLMHGEYVDARKSLGDFGVFGYDDKSWKSPGI